MEVRSRRSLRANQDHSACRRCRLHTQGVRIIGSSLSERRGHGTRSVPANTGDILKGRIQVIKIRRKEDSGVEPCPGYHGLDRRAGFVPMIFQHDVFKVGWLMAEDGGDPRFVRVSPAFLAVWTEGERNRGGQPALGSIGRKLRGSNPRERGAGNCQWANSQNLLSAFHRRGFRDRSRTRSLGRRCGFLTDRLHRPVSSTTAQPYPRCESGSKHPTLSFAGSHP